MNNVRETLMKALTAANKPYSINAVDPCIYRLTIAEYFEWIS